MLLILPTGQDLELHSATEGEEDAEMLKTDANDGGDEDEEEGEDDGDDLMISKTFALFDGTETTKKQPKTQHDSATGNLYYPPSSSSSLTTCIRIGHRRQ